MTSMQQQLFDFLNNLLEGRPSIYDDDFQIVDLRHISQEWAIMVISSEGSFKIKGETILSPDYFNNN